MDFPKTSAVDGHPTTKLTADELQLCCETMAKGNTALKEAAARVGMDQREFRAHLFSGHGFIDASPDDLSYIKAAVPLIQAVRSIEDKMRDGFKNLARKYAKSWARKFSSPVVQEEDYLQEALMALSDAVYGYTGGVEFITYASTAIRNRLVKEANHARPMGALTNEAQKLLQQFEKTKATFNCRVTEDEVFDAMGIDEDQRSVIRKSTVKVVSGHGLQGQRSHADDHSRDYSEFRRGADRENDTVSADFEVVDDIAKMKVAIKYADLNDLEQQVINAYLEADGEWGWQSEFARKSLNPRTQQPYTRALVGQVLKSALEKIKVSYLKEAA